MTLASTVGEKLNTKPCNLLKHVGSFLKVLVNTSRFLPYNCIEGQDLCSSSSLAVGSWSHNFIEVTFFQGQIKK